MGFRTFSIVYHFILFYSRMHSITNEMAMRLLFMGNNKSVFWTSWCGCGRARAHRMNGWDWMHCDRIDFLSNWIRYNVEICRRFDGTQWHSVDGHRKMKVYCFDKDRETFSVRGGFRLIKNHCLRSIWLQTTIANEHLPMNLKWSDASHRSHFSVVNFNSSKR